MIPRRSMSAGFVVLVAVIALGCLSGCGTVTTVSDGELPDGCIRYRIVTYGSTFTAKNDCGGTTLIVRPGESVYWVNTTDAMQTVTFDPDDKLIFGIDKFEIPKGSTVVLKVDDTLDGKPTHQYRFSLTSEAVKDFIESVSAIEGNLRVEDASDTATEIPVGPPGIIVCPPGQNCG